jgi:DNA-directed RNA polymerase specialized sigma24 family protein
VENAHEQPAVFAQRFKRGHRLLRSIAYRVLGDEKRAAIAIQNCWRTASRNPPRFESEDAFRSWLIRILIDEAVAILRDNQGERDAAATVANAVSMSDSAVKSGLG